MSKAARILFAGGGTGGHLFPAIAVAEALGKLRPDSIISFVGSADRIEARVVPGLGFDFDTIWIAGLKRSVSLGSLLLPLKILVSLLQSLRILHRRAPHVVVGTGGYVSGPLVYAAAKTGRRTLIHEQNEYPGITTRLLARQADEVHVTWESSLKRIGRAKRTVLSGNPVRLSLARIDASDARESYGLQPGRRTLFVFGGSLGASSINRAVRALTPRLVREDFQLIWQTGARDYSEFAPLGALYTGQVVVRAFIDDMDKAYSAADLVVCRAGATSLAELTALGIPSILVPYPHAAANHQYCNAVALSDRGAARVVRDDELHRLEHEAFSLLADTMELQRMSANAAALGRPQAAIDIAEAVLRLAQQTEGG